MVTVWPIWTALVSKCLGIGAYGSSSGQGVRVPALAIMKVIRILLWQRQSLATVLMPVHQKVSSQGRSSQWHYRDVTFVKRETVRRGWVLRLCLKRYSARTYFYTVVSSLHTAVVVLYVYSRVAVRALIYDVSTLNVILYSTRATLLLASSIIIRQRSPQGSNQRGRVFRRDSATRCPPYFIH